MDSRIVTREIRREIWPALRCIGFHTFVGRRAFRQSGRRTWVVNFQSFNSYFASVDGCTTFSFAVNLGIHIPILDDRPEPPATTLKDFDCHLRRQMRKGIEQVGYARKDIWYVDPQGENVLEVLADARSVLTGEGVLWFRRFDDDDELLRTLVEDDENEALFGIGARWSPQRKTLIGRLAVSLGREDLGLRLLQEADAEIRSSRLAIESLARNRRTPREREPG